jgi:hypothetical protein
MTNSPKIITVKINRGLIEDVTGLPKGYELHVLDHDGDDTAHPSWDAEKGCFVTIYDGAPIPKQYTVGSSHGELTLDGEGYITHCRVDNDDADGGRHLKSITRFDLVEWRKHWGNPEASHIDILDLGYWYTDPKTHETAFALPDANWRAEIAEILLGRARPDPGERMRCTSRPQPTPPYRIGVSNDDGDCYDICIMQGERPIATLIAPEDEIESLVYAANAFDCAARKLGASAGGFAGRMADGGLAELVEALDYLLEQTVDMDLKYGIELSEGEEDARARALAIIAKVKGIAA